MQQNTGYMQRIGGEVSGSTRAHEEQMKAQAAPAQGLPAPRQRQIPVAIDELTVVCHSLGNELESLLDGLSSVADWPIKTDCNTAQAGAPPATPVPLAESIQSNIRLLRHLINLVRSFKERVEL